MPEDGPGAAAGVDVVRAGRGQVDLGLAAAPPRRGASPTRRSCSARAGRTSTARCSTAGCVDELDLTISPVLAGGDGPRVTSGAAATLARFDLAHLATDGRLPVRALGAARRQRLARAFVSSSISRWKSAAASKFL